MSYLIYNDFRRFIQSDNLQQIVNKDNSIITDAILDSQAFATERLVQKFLLDQEFADTDTYDPSLSYNAGDRVYLDGPAYNPAAAYIQGELTLYNGNVYVAIVPIPTPESFNPQHWVLLGLQYQIFFVKYPATPFVLNGTYKIGDIVFWRNSVYTALKATSQIDHETLLQFNLYQNVPLRNIFPDDPDNGPAIWGMGVPYSVPAGTLYPDPVNKFSPQYSQTFQTDYTSVANGTSVIDLSATILNKAIVQITKETKPLTPSQFLWNSSTGILTLIGTPVDSGQTLFILYSNIIVDPVPTGWVQGDNRNRSLVRHCAALVLYFIHDRIAPRNIPELRSKKYKEAVKWLEDALEGNLTAGLPVIQPRSGGRIRWGGNIKNINGF